MESTSNARNWDNPEADLTKGQRVRGMARSSIADAISEKFGIVGQRASDKIKGKGGTTIGQMAKSVGKKAIGEKFGPLGQIAAMGKGDKKQSATSDAAKSKSDSATKQFSDLKTSNANNTIMLRNMNGSLKSIDQKLEDILFSQERMENMLNRMIMDRGASKRSNLGEAQFQDSYENDPDQKSGGFNFDLDVDRKRKNTKTRPGSKKPGAGRRLLDGARGAVKGRSLPAMVVGGVVGAAVGSQLNDSIEKDKEDFKTKVYLDKLKEKLKDHPEKDKLLKAYSSMEPSEQHAFFMKYFHALAFKTTNEAGITELEKLANVKPENKKPEDKPTTPAANSPAEKTPDDKPTTPAPNAPAEKVEGLGSKVVQTLAGTAGGLATSPLGPFGSSLGSMGGAMLGGYVYDAISNYFNPSKSSDATKAPDAKTQNAPAAKIPDAAKSIPIERYDTGADSREAEVVMQDTAISSKDPREHLIAAVKSGKIKDYNSFIQGLRTAVTASGIKDNIDISISKLRFWVWQKVAEANGGKFTGSGPEFVEAFIKIYGGTPDLKALEADKNAIEEWKKSQAGEPETAIAEKQAPATSAPGAGTNEESKTGVAENQASTTPSAAGSGSTTPSASGGPIPSVSGGTQAGPPSAVTPSAGGDKGATPRSGSEESLLSAAKAAGIKDPTELAQFMAQMAHESGNFKHLQEIWGPTTAQKRYEGRKDLGNVQQGDGYKFRGRGYVQLTGRANYRSFGAQIGVDLENNPDLASQPDIAARLAIAYWNTRVKSRVRDFENTRAITRLINGGFNGLSDREAKFKKYKEQKDLAGSGAAGAGSTAPPSAEGGSTTSAPAPSAGGGGGEMPGVDIMGNATGMPQAGGATAAPGAGPSGGTGAPGAGPSGGATPPTLAPPGAGSTGPAAEGAGTAAGDKSGQNGMLPPSSLSPVGVGSHKAQPVAADAFKAMRAAAAKDKVDLGITDSYRSYAAQVDVKRRKPNLAATPGKSNHGWGLAFDMSFGSNQNSPGYKWMTQNASKFGFKGPLQKPFEPWHWEYKGGGSPDAMSAAGGGGQKDAAPAGAEGAGATASPSPSAGSGSGSGGSGGAEGAGGSGSMAAASPTGGGGGGPCPPAENTAKPATTPVETGADLNRRSTDIELSKSSVQPPIVVAGGTGEKAGHTVPNGGGAQEGTPISAVPEGGFAEQLASGIAGSLVESTGSNSMSMNRRAAGGSMAA
jgi:putative chitinase